MYVYIIYYILYIDLYAYYIDVYIYISIQRNNIFANHIYPNTHPGADYIISLVDCLTKVL